MISHGYNATYQQGCRCEKCTTAHREYMRAWRHENNKRVISATRSRIIIELLLTDGETVTSIAKKSGVSYQTVTNILLRQVAYVRYTTSEKIRKLDRWGVTLPLRSMYEH